MMTADHDLLHQRDAQLIVHVTEMTIVLAIAVIMDMDGARTLIDMPVIDESRLPHTATAQHHT